MKEKLFRTAYHKQLGVYVRLHNFRADHYLFTGKNITLTWTHKNNLNQFLL